MYDNIAAGMSPPREMPRMAVGFQRLARIGFAEGVDAIDVGGPGGGEVGTDRRIWVSGFRRQFDRGFFGSDRWGSVFFGSGRWVSHLQLEASVDEALGDVGVAHEFKEALVYFLGGVHVGADDVGLLTGVGR